MAKCNTAVNNGMAEVKQEFGVTDDEMDSLRKQIEAWTNTHDDEEVHFLFKVTQIHVNQMGDWTKH